MERQPTSVPMNLLINGNYLIIETETRGSNYKETTEFQLKNVFFKTENEAFIIRDNTYRAFITFVDVDSELVSIEKTQVSVNDLFYWLCLKTGSIGNAIG
jgi:hypothetical protein